MADINLTTLEASGTVTLEDIGLPLENLIVSEWTGCWLWTGARVPSGYGRVGDSGYAHRMAYSNAVGSVPVDLDIDHLCRVKSCVNPAHLEPVSRAENMRRAFKAKPRRRRTECRYGHAFDDDNTYWGKQVDGSPVQVCRSCSARRQREYRLRKQGN